MYVTKPFNDLVKAYHDGYRTIGMKGSARSGKTRGIIQFLDFVGDTSKKHRKLSIVSQTFPHLREGALYEYQKHIREERLVREHTKQDHEYKINQSVINYFSADNPDRAIGPGRDIGYINEVNRNIPFSVFNDMKQRTAECMICDWNPAGDFFFHDKENGIMDDPRTIILHSTFLDNINNLSKAQIQDFIDAKKKSKTSDFWRYWWEVYGEGKDSLLLEERIMPILKKVSKVPDDAYEIPSALDFGFFPDPTFFGRLFVRPGVLKDDLYIQEIVYNQKLSINTKSDGAANLVDLLLAKGISKKHLIIAESADPRAISELRGAGFSIEAVKKSTVETSIRLFHDYNIHIVNPDTHNGGKTWKEFDNYKYKRNKKGVILGIPDDGQQDHSIDGTRYVLLSRNSRWSIPDKMYDPAVKAKYVVDTKKGN